jgi:sulfate adenylyltransferase subunit 1
MITGASNSDLAIILIDARNGINEQTKRHSIISSLLNISHLVICINKMDLVDYSKEVFEKIVNNYITFASKLKIKEVQFIPVSALLGDNVVEKSWRMPWYEGKSLLNHLEEIHIEPHHSLESRFPVQWIIRPNNGHYHDYRGYAGKIISGVFRKGDNVIGLPSGFNTTIKNIEIFGKEVEEAFAPMSVVIHLSDDLDIHRGDLIVRSSDESLPIVSSDIEAMVCWMDVKPMIQGNKYLLQHNSKVVKCVIKEIINKIDVNSLDEVKNSITINLNDICRVRIRTAHPLTYDEYKKNKANGNFILIDEYSNTTIGAGMIG